MYFKAPDEEERRATYKGLGFEEFKNLNDEEIAALRKWERKEFDTACGKYDLFSAEWRVAAAKFETLSSFRTWRQSGIPDRDMTHEEWDARLAHYIAIRRHADPSYGTLTDSDLARLTAEEREVVFHALDENINSDHSSQPILDVGGPIEHAMKRLDVTYEDLVKKGVLEIYETPETVSFDSSTGYVLAGKFGQFVLALPFDRNK